MDKEILYTKEFLYKELAVLLNCMFKEKLPASIALHLITLSNRSFHGKGRSVLP